MWPFLSRPGNFQSGQALWLILVGSVAALKEQANEKRSHRPATVTYSGGVGVAIFFWSFLATGVPQLTTLFPFPNGYNIAQYTMPGVPDAMISSQNRTAIVFMALVARN